MDIKTFKENFKTVVINFLANENLNYLQAEKDKLKESFLSLGDVEISGNEEQLFLEFENFIFIICDNPYFVSLELEDFHGMSASVECFK